MNRQGSSRAELVASGNPIAQYREVTTAHRHPAHAEACVVSKFAKKPIVRNYLTMLGTSLLNPMREDKMRMKCVPIDSWWGVDRGIGADFSTK